ncbi:12403_t:CDS:1, partial [Racocetra fulgida]
TPTRYVEKFIQILALRNGIKIETTQALQQLINQSPLAVVADAPSFIYNYWNS